MLILNQVILAFEDENIFERNAFQAALDKNSWKSFPLGGLIVALSRLFLLKNDGKDRNVGEVVPGTGLEPARL